MFNQQKKNCDLIKENYLDVLQITETWLKDNDTAKICEMMTPVTYTFLHTMNGDEVVIILSNSFKKVRKKTERRETAGVTSNQL